jgi:hypothetical protein
MLVLVLKGFRMIFRIGFSILFCLAVSSSSAFAQVTFKFKHRHDQKTITKLLSSMSQTLVINGNTIKSAQGTNMVMSGKTGRTAEGKVTGEIKTESMQVTVAIGDLIFLYDSKEPDEKGTTPLEYLREYYKWSMGKKVKVVYGKDFKVESVETDTTGFEDLSEQVKQQVGDPDTAANTMKTAINQVIERFPSGPVKKGDTWKRKSDAPLGQGQVLHFESEYKYEGVIEKDGKKLHKITSKVLSADFTIAADSTLPIKVKSADLKPADESNGVILFDMEWGNIVEQSGLGRVTGDLVFVQGEQEIPATLDLKMESKTENSVAK